ncbi:MAG: mechanosensitive ion channel domain-containing protein [Candidatus Korobacteraceae bacterium]
MFQRISLARAARLSASAGYVVLILLCLAASATAQPGVSLSSLLGNKNNSQASQPAPPPSTPAEAQPPTAIPLPDVATRAEDLMRFLRDINNQLPTREQLDAMKATLEERDAALRAKKKEVDALLSGSASALELREQETYWQAVSTEGTATRKQLLDWANAAQSSVQQLQALQPQWTATLEENKNTPDLGPTLDVIRDAVKSIQTTKAQTQDLLRVIVNLQVSAANQHQLALDITDQLARSRTQMKDRVLQRDSLPLWQIFLRRQQGEQPPDFLSNRRARMIGIESFAQENLGIFFLLGLLLLFSLFGAYRLAVGTRGMEPAAEPQASALAITQHWFALGLLPPLLLAFLLAPRAPLPLIGLTILLSFFSILILLPPLIAPRFRKPLYWLVGVYAFNAVLTWIELSSAAKREVQFLGSSAAVVLFAYLFRPKRIAEEEKPATPPRLLIFGTRMAIAALALAQLANLLGYYKFTQFLTVLCVYSTFIALAAFTALRVFTILLLAALEAPSAERLAMVRLHRAGIARWAPRVLQWAGILVWLGATLELMGVRTWVNEQIVALLDFNIAGGSSNITLGGVLGFWAILLAGFAFSTSLRFLLREEMLKRLRLKRGIPELISTTLHYLLLLLVFLFAVNAGGVALNKFTVITGALGVGVGFGLQNIINNFVSGLILQFERPIRVGDVVEIQAGLTGTVTRIGIRASTVQTFQGAEVIIPNATFISSNVTNWTLSEARRRVDLPVGVAYGTDPKVVKDLLERPAVQHPDVLTSPDPAVFFKEFGESALNFELQFWVMQESNVTRVKSEVALEVMRLLAEADIEIPFPQRDLHLRGVDSAAAGLLAGNGATPVSVASDADVELRTRSKSSVAGE